MNESPSLGEESLAQELRASRGLLEAPDELILAAIARWEPGAKPQAGPALRRLLNAMLSSDSLWPGLSPATRADRDEMRQLCYRLEGRDVDLRWTRCGSTTEAGWALSGQILGPDRGGRMRVRCGPFDATVEWSELCEFHLEPIPCGECVITLQTEDWEAVLPVIVLESTA